MITTWLPNAISNFLTGGSPTNITHIGYGTDSTAETVGDTSLASEVGTRRAPTITQTDKLLEMTSIMNSTADASGSTIKETATFDALTSGNLFDRQTNSTGLALTGSNELTVQKRYFVDNTLPALNFFASQVSGWFGGTISPPTHIGFGVNYTLERCESSPAWTASADAIEPFPKTANFQEGTASIGMGKDGTSSASFDYSQTLASGVDISDGDSFIIWLNIDNATDYAKFATTGALKIYLGNDSSNYYLLSLDKSELFVGWQRIQATIWSGFTETGSVDDTDIDYLKIEFTLTGASETISSGNLLMDYWNVARVITASDSSLASEIGARLSTTKSYVDNESRFVAVLDSSTNNSYKIAEVGLFDAGTGGNIWVYDKSINLLKDSSNQIRQEFRIRVRYNE